MIGRIEKGPTLVLAHAVPDVDHALLTVRAAPRCRCLAEEIEARQLCAPCRQALWGSDELHALPIRTAQSRGHQMTLRKPTETPSLCNIAGLCMQMDMPWHAQNTRTFNTGMGIRELA